MDSSDHLNSQAEEDTALEHAWTVCRDVNGRRDAARGLMRTCRLAGHYRQDVLALGCLVHACGDEDSDPPTDAAQWAFLDELALMAYYCGYKGMAARLLRSLLPVSPMEQYGRLRTNLTFAGAPLGCPMVQASHTFTWADCLPLTSAVVYVQAAGPATAVVDGVYCGNTLEAIFDPLRDLVRAWVVNAGGVCTPSPHGATVHVYFTSTLLETPIPDIPYIMVATEQPTSWCFQRPPVKALLAGAQSVWCMDVADADFIHYRFGVAADRLRILPVTFAPFYTPVHKADGDEGPPVTVLHYGHPTPRRRVLLDAIRTALPDAVVVDTGNTFAEALDALIQRAAVVVVPSAYDPDTSVLGLHRLSRLLQFPTLKVVVESLPGSVYCDALLRELFGNRLSLVPYADMVHATTTAVALPTSAIVPGPVIPFADALWHWNGCQPWTEFVGNLKT